jgi:hypothetical protein
MKVSETVCSLNKGDVFYSRELGIYKNHIVAIVGNENQIVWKYYGKHKQWWHYEIQSIYSFNQSLKIGLYKLNRKDYD